MKFGVIPRKMQKTEIFIDYYNRKVDVYCNKRTVIRRLIKRIDTDYQFIKNNDDEITAIKFSLDFTHKDLKKLLSINSLLGSMRIGRE